MYPGLVYPGYYIMSSKKTFLIIAGAIFLVGVGGSALFLLQASSPGFFVASTVVIPSGQNFKVGNEEIEVLPTSTIAGISCENHSGRPFAVMIAEDPEARPLSGIGSADLVVEMPVITGSVTRLLSVFQCTIPREIGSIRSARHDYIPLVMGLDAIFVHWGGSHYALDKLNRRIMDNINALFNPFGAFYRNPNIPRPHNGFTSEDRLLNAAKGLGYRMETMFEGYPRTQEETPNPKLYTPHPRLTIGYPYPFNVSYAYNPETNNYLRWRGNKEEIDRLTDKQVEVKNIVIMRARSRQIEGQYNDVDIEGLGEAMVYRNGEEIKGTWSKDKTEPKSKLYFYDKTGNEIEFVPGSIWIHVVEPYQRVKLE